MARRLFARSLSLCSSALAVSSIAAWKHGRFVRCDEEKGVKRPIALESAARASLAKIDSIEHDFASFRPDPARYERMDHVIFEEELFKQVREQHAIYSSLCGENRIEGYEIYRSKDDREIYCILKFGDKLNGWPNVVHGGITALVIDNSFGWLFASFNMPKAVTANLNINYRSPIMENSCSILRAKVEKIEGRKLFMNAKVENAVSRAVQAEATTLFIFVP